MDVYTSRDIEAVLYKMERHVLKAAIVLPGDPNWSDFDAEDYEDGKKVTKCFTLREHSNVKCRKLIGLLDIYF